MTKREVIAPGKTELGQSPEQLREKIRQRAYKLYEQRGREDGAELDDCSKLNQRSPEMICTHELRMMVAPVQPSARRRG